MADFAARSFGVFQEQPRRVTLRFSPATAPDAAWFLFHPSLRGGLAAGWLPAGPVHRWRHAGAVTPPVRLGHGVGAAGARQPARPAAVRVVPNGVGPPHESTASLPIPRKRLRRPEAHGFPVVAALALGRQ